MWTIPEIVISVCHDDEPHNELTGEKESGNAGSRDDNCLVPSCQYNCSDQQILKSVSPMEKALTNSNLPVPSVENITLDSVGEEGVTEKQDVKDNEKALTDSHLSIASVENITLDPVAEEVVTKKQDVKEEVKNR